MAQADDGESLGVQQRVVQGYAMLKGLDLAHTYVEAGISGSVPLGDRPQGALMMGILGAGDSIIVPKMDRAFRSALDALTTLETLKSRKIALHIVDLGGDVTADGHSKLIFTILNAVAEAERDMIRTRIRDVKRDQKARGRYLGGAVPWTHAVQEDGSIVAVQERVEMVELMRTWAEKGASNRLIAAKTRDNGFRVSEPTVAKLLREYDHPPRC